MGHDVHDASFATLGKPVTIGDRAVLFAGAMVMPGVTIGAGSVVMAGSVVTKSVPPMRMVGGNPAHDIGPRQGTPRLYARPPLLVRALRASSWPARRQARAVRIAVVDGGSFVLPYDYQIVKALTEHGMAVEFFGSACTRYNGELLEAMRELPGVVVHDSAVSGTVAPRWRGALAYAAMWFTLWRRRREFDAVNLQFSAWWPLEKRILPLLGDRLVVTVHNAVPHGFTGRRHAPTERLAELARTLVFASRFSHDEFIDRYGERFRAKSRTLPHGLLPVIPELPPQPYAAQGPPEALVYWSVVKPYKGVEIFLELARSERIRAMGLRLEIHGAWAPELSGLHAELVALGVHMDDTYLDAPELLGAALAQRRLPAALPRSVAIRRPVCVAAPGPLLHLRRRRRSRRADASLRPRGAAARPTAAPMRWPTASIACVATRPG